MRYLKPICNPGLARRLRGAALALGLAGAMAAPTLCQANPQGAQVVHGSAAFAMPDASTLNVTNAPGTVINWQQFGIAPGELTRFIQQSALSAVLNRVVGGDPSAILGSLLSNGQVFLINPNGVVFGPNAVVDTAGLLVSTLNMADEDFLAGRLHFAGDGGEGAVVNQGSLHASGGVVLIAPRIENSGLVESDGGGLLLAAGREVTITSLENPEISYQLRAPEHEAVNLGRLVTKGGPASVFAGSIRHSGEIDAGAVTVGTDGTVRLVASGDITLEAGSRIVADGADGGRVHVESEGGTTRLDDASVSARGLSGDGGEVALLGREVILAGATEVDVSGESGGGEVLVGGDYQGANPDVRNAERSFAGTETTIRADAGASGDGGKVILWADDVTIAGGTITARGGAGGGDGGFVEVSGKRQLGFSAFVDTRAPAGEAGLLLLDPTNIVVAAGGGVALTTVLFNDGAPPCDNATTCTVNVTAINAAVSPVLLQATNDIDFNAAVSIGVATASLTAQARNNITVNAGIATSNASVTLSADDDGIGGGNLVLNQAIDAGSGDVNLSAGGGSIIQGVSGSIGGGKLKATAGTGINLDTTTSQVLQFTADNTTSGDIRLSNNGNPLDLSNNGTAFAVRNQGPGQIIITNGDSDVTVSDLVIGNGSGIIDIAGAGDGGANVTVLQPVVQQGTGNVVIRAEGNGRTVTLTGLGTVSALGGSVTLTGDELAVGAAVSALNEVRLHPQTGRPMDLGAVGDATPGVTEVSNAEIQNLTAQRLVVGDAGLGTGKITVSAPITLPASLNELTLTNTGGSIDVNAALNAPGRAVLFVAGGAGTGDGDIRQLAAGVITAATLTILADQQIALGGSGAVNQIGGFAAGSNALLNSGIRLDNNSGGVALALNSITSANADIDVSNAGGTSITGPVDGGTGNVTITESTLGINGGGGSVAGNLITLSASNTVNGGVGNGTQVKTDAGAGGLLVNSLGAGGAGNVDIEEANAISLSNVSITTGAGVQIVKLATASGALTIDAPIGNTQDDLTLAALANAIANPTADRVTANNLTLTADAGVGSPVAAQSILTSANSITASSVSGGAIAIDNDRDVNILGLTTPGGGVIAFNQQGGTGAVTISGAVDAGSAGPISITASSPLNVNANVTGVSAINLTSTGGAPNDLTIAPGVLVQATGAGSTVTINGAGNVIHDGLVQSDLADLDLDAGNAYIMGAAGVARAPNGDIQLDAVNGVQLGLLDAPSGGPGVNAGSGAIVDANAAATNIIGIDTTLLATGGIGTVADPIETQVARLNNVTTSTGDIAISNTGNLQTSVVTPISTGAGAVQIASTGTLNPRNNVSATNRVRLSSVGQLRIQGDVTGNDIVLFSQAGNISAEGLLQSNATGLAPSTFAIDIDAAGGGAVDVEQATVASGGMRVIGEFDVDLDGGDNDVIYSIPGDFVVTSEAGRIVNGGSAVITAASALLRALSDIDLASITTTSGGIDLGSTSGLVRINNGSTTPEQLVSATDVIVNAPNGDLQLGDDGVTANALIANIGGDFRVAFSAGTPVQTTLDSLSLTSAGGDIRLFNSKALALGPVVSPGGLVDVRASGSLTDANGAGLNVQAAQAVLGADGAIGSFAAPLQTAVGSLQLLRTNGASAFSGEVGIVNSGPLTLASSVFGASDVALVGTAGLDISGFLTVESTGGQVLLGAGTGLLLVDQSTVNAATVLTATGGSVDFYSASVNATDVQVIATSLVHLTAGDSIATNVNVSGNASITAGELLVEGGPLFGDSAKLLAGGGITVNAGNVTVRGGAGDNAAASIDPTLLVINAAGDILVQGGTGAGSLASVVGDTVDITAAGALSVLGSNNLAVIESLVGGLNIQTGGPITVLAGSAPLGDAVIVAAGGAGAVNVVTPGASGVGLVLLGGNPFLPPFDTTAEAGVFAASLNITAPPLPPAAGGDGETNELNADEVLVLLDIFDQLSADGGSGDDDDEDDYRRICR